MRRELSSYDRDHVGLDKEAPDYREKLHAWAAADRRSEQALDDALCLVIFAAQEEAAGGTTGMAWAGISPDALDAAIDAVLEAMPTHAKVRFDELMKRAACAS